jgi:outer membrane lipoprotein SlyB
MVYLEESMKSKFSLVVIMLTGLITAGFLSACTPDISAGSYTSNQIGQAAPTMQGRIIAATPIKVSSGDNSVGTVAGALAGGIAGSAIGGGSRANALGAVGGAVLGGVIGNYAQQNLSTQTGMQYTVRLRNRQLYTVTQGMNPMLGVGQPVMVIFSNPARVVPLY